MPRKPLSQKLHEEAMKNPEYTNIHEELALFRELVLQIVQFRCEQGLSQEELAQRIGTSRSTIARIESLDYGRMSLTTLRRIADALGLVLNISFQKAN